MGLLQGTNRFHLVGIGGIGLSAIARVLHGWGYQVTGSDQETSALTDALIEEGISVFAGHRAEQVEGADVVVISSAVPADNPEVVAARRLGLPVVKREQLLGDLTASRTTIAVAGTHGKTTTSAMLAWILTQAGLDPTFIVGGVLQNLGTNARAGRGPHFVIEADEYDRTFLGLKPHVAVITTLEHDHPDCYPTLGEMVNAFETFAHQIQPGGLLIVCGQDPEAHALGKRYESAGGRLETYGLDHSWNWRAEGVRLGHEAAMDVWHRGKLLGSCALQVPGRHNVLNALAALAASHELQVGTDDALAALTRFRGTARRFEIKGQVREITVVDDYAHHPTEIQATLAAARHKYPGRRIWAVFQPHTYSRTRALLDGFAGAFQEADRMIVTGIYAAREPHDLEVSGADIVARSQHQDARYVESIPDVVALLLSEVKAGDIVITLGAGNGYLIGERLLSELSE